MIELNLRGSPKLFLLKAKGLTLDFRNPSVSSSLWPSSVRAKWKEAKSKRVTIMDTADL